MTKAAAPRQRPECGVEALLPLTILWLQLSAGFSLYQACHEVVVARGCEDPRSRGSGCRHRGGAPWAGPCGGRGSHQRLQLGLPVRLRAVGADLGCAARLTLILHSWGGRRGQGCLLYTSDAADDRYKV